MIPILSAIIIGEGARVTRARGFALSLAYVIGMALVYTALGVAAALVGQSLGAWLQNPWVLGAFGVLLTVFALDADRGFRHRVAAALAGRRVARVDRTFRRQVRRGRGDGCAVRAGGRRLHDRAAFCRAGVHRAYGRRVARRCGAVLDGTRARRAAPDHRSWRRYLAAARGRVDGRRQGVLRRRAACGGPVDRVAGARCDRAPCC